MKRLIPFLFLALVACKTRKIVTDSSRVKSETTTEQQTQIHASDSSKSVDTSLRTKESHEESKTESENTTEFHADSAITTVKPDGTTRTKYYINGNVKTMGKSSSNKVVTKKDTTKKNIVKIQSHKLDSLSSSKSATKIDSTKFHKETDAKGSGTEWAKWVGIACIIGVILFFLLAWLKFKKKP